MLPWVWISLVIVASLIYILIFRQYTIDHNWAWFIPIVIFGAISFYGYYKVLSAGDIGASYGIMTGAIVVLVAIGSALFFQEKFNLMKIIGLGLIVLGVGLLAASQAKTK